MEEVVDQLKWTRSCPDEMDEVVDHFQLKK